MNLVTNREMPKGKDGSAKEENLVAPWKENFLPSIIHQVYLNDKLIEAPQFHENDGSMAVFMQILVFCNDRTTRERKEEGAAGNLLLDFAARKGFHKKLFETIVPKFTLYRLKTRPWITSAVIKLNGNYRLILQDEPERILDQCDKMLLKGKREAISANRFKRITGLYEKMAAEHSQVIALAYKDIEKSTGEFQNIFCSSNFTLAGMIGLN